VIHSRVSSFAIRHKHRTSREKRSSLLQTFTNYVFRKFTTQGPGKRRGEGGTGFASTVMRIRKQCLIKCSADRREPPGGGLGNVSAFAAKRAKAIACILLYCNLRPHIWEAKCLPIGQRGVTWPDRGLRLVETLPFWTRGWPISRPLELCDRRWKWFVPKISGSGFPPLSVVSCRDS
jgi:hypothetical protein